ncbi:Uncharacterised protein [Chryseobacterium carnipullorum]|uniref:Uncharacterized protein n=1 Tax=Chryseobacterium carnipullorum TaxID=1124835 RepID=A0A376DXG3_CHRCU|nr:Uncharacterised protein [Chryseobacterium carnipullorum]
MKPTKNQAILLKQSKKPELIRLLLLGLNGKKGY